MTNSEKQLPLLNIDGAVPSGANEGTPFVEPGEFATPQVSGITGEPHSPIGIDSAIVAAGSPPAATPATRLIWYPRRKTSVLKCTP